MPVAASGKSVIPASCYYGFASPPECLGGLEMRVAVSSPLLGPILQDIRRPDVL
jgi:hypothetical protein